MVKIEIGRNEAGQRLDRFLKKYLADAPLSYIYRAIRKDVKVNGKRKQGDAILEEGDQVTLYISDENLEAFIRKKRGGKAKRQFKIAYEDENIIAVEKPRGLLTHGDSTEKKNHLANQVIDYLIDTEGYDPRTERTFTPAPVNRLDRNTTGLVLFGKNGPALRELNRTVRERTAIRKYYLTVTAGEMKRPLALNDRMVKDREKNMVLLTGEEGGKSMETMARPLAAGDGFSLVEVEILTGRTHQIRAQLAKAGFPLIGDPKYGDGRINRDVRIRFGLSYQLLHACRISFGRTKGVLAYLEGVEITADLPDDFRRIVESIFGKEVSCRPYGS